MSGDLISRKALLGKLFPYGMPDNGNYGINARAVRDAVVSAKAVEAEPVVHAHWIEDDHACCRNCSACGFEVDDDAATYLYGDYQVKPKRCPECGAHMDEEVTE